MSCEQNYPFPQVFLVDEDGGPQPPSLVPCWSFPPAQDERRRKRKSVGFFGVSHSLAVVVLFLFLLVFAALGFGALLIQNMQNELHDIRNRTNVEEEHHSAQKQIGFHMPEKNDIDTYTRPAAHVIGRIHKDASHKTLRWEPRVGRAFTAGGVAYRPEDGALQINETGLYHIYSRVELIFKQCSPTASFVHSVFVRRAGNPSSLILMEAHRARFCSQQQAHIWTSESYLGSALPLQKLDRVFVNVSHPLYLSHGHYSNFFGLYKI
ncbi:tumor necrosis factor ligand superfamily member 6 [Thalassophryne amazonica]|uniref:tumor necrosis factor ligand superfamily member 6 n=1 Tax=Thalassophryne amazonica TaxID=390379 RepID=UPI0014711E8B|nr:tumor necrosis factor ligand superfamily member 6 [Thalassophryne amazonica]